MKNLAIIKRFLRGELSDRERSDFEARLRTDPELAQELDTYKGDQVEQVATQLYRNRQLRESLLERGRQKLHTQRRWRMFLGITAVLLLTGLIFFLIPRTPGSPDDQIKREDIDRDTIGQMRVSGPIAAFMVPYDVARLRELGSVQDYLEAYQAGNYSAVIENLPDLIQKGSINANLGHLLVGSSKLFVDDAENALQELQQVAPQSLYGPWAQWYEALALYQTGAKAEARSLLDAIQKHPNPALSNLAQQFLADMPFD